MIARIWSARTSTESWPRYAHHFTQNVVPELQAVRGYAGSQLLNRQTGDAVEITVITCWQSWEAIDGFAGTDREAAVVAPEAAALLTEYGRRVRHYEIAFSDQLGTGR